MKKLLFALCALVLLAACTSSKNTTDTAPRWWAPYNNGGGVSFVSTDQANGGGLFVRFTSDGVHCAVCLTDHVALADPVAVCVSYYDGENKINNVQYIGRAFCGFVQLDKAAASSVAYFLAHGVRRSVAVDVPSAQIKIVAPANPQLRQYVK